MRQTTFYRSIAGLAVAIVLAVGGPAGASVTGTSSRVDYVGNGASKVFSFSFATSATDPSWVQVLLGGVVQVSGYTVTLNPNQSASPGGSVTFTTAPAAPVTVRIQRVVPYTQTLVLNPYSAFPATSVTGTLDKMTMQSQQLARDQADAIAAAATATANSTAAAASAAAAQAAVQAAGVAGSNTLVTATGASLARTLGDAAADVANVKGYVSPAAAAANADQTVAAPTGSYALSSPITLKYRQNFLGYGPGSVMSPSGGAFVFNATSDAWWQGRLYSMLGNLKINSSAGIGDLVTVTNPVTGSTAMTSMRDLLVTGWANGYAAVKLKGVYPGNVFGTTLFNVNGIFGAGHGLWLTTTGLYGTAVTNVIASSFEGNGGNGILVDSGGGAGAAHSTLNVYGTLLQGNTLAPIAIDGLAASTFIGNYTEQVAATNSMVNLRSPVLNQGLAFVGNNFGAAPNVVSYGIESGSSAGGSSRSVVSHANHFSNIITAAYKIDRLYDSMLGPDDFTSPPSSIANWTTASGWNRVMIWDTISGVWSFSSDAAANVEQPKIGLGKRGDQVTATVHIGGTQPTSVVAGGNGIDATAALKVDGATGGITYANPGYTAGAGADISLASGTGGNTGGASTVGRGGDITFTAGGPGTGGSTANRSGRITLGGAQVHKRTTITYSTSMTPDASASSYQTITATNGTAFAINAPTFAIAGSLLTITIQNASGGALGTATWDAYYHLSAWTQPANTFNRSITFMCNGTACLEISRTPADVPN